jgi:hypothetical protein
MVSDLLRVKYKAFVFVVYSAVNFDKVRECNRYIICLKIVFSNNWRSKII